MSLRPFWRYYGGKWRAAHRYPPPTYSCIVEPFAGSAGYALRHSDLQVVLCDKDPCIAGIWRYLISATSSEIERIPLVDTIDDLPGWVPQEGRDLVGFWLSAAVTSPRRTLSAGNVKLRAMGKTMIGWCERSRERVASQVGKIKHWRIVEGSYTDLPDAQCCTWFVDPPYNNRAGSHYVHGPSGIDYVHLGAWCRSRPHGQVIVCENEGADWLPFEFMSNTKAMQTNTSRRTSAEVLWTGGVP